MLIKFGVGDAMSWKNILICLFALLPAGGFWSFPLFPAAAEVAVDPHTQRGCLHCHHSDNPKEHRGTLIFESSEEGPHGVLAHSCRTCHKEGKDNFWIVVLPRGRSGGLPPASGGDTLTGPSPAAGGGVQEEGFANSHDSLECTSCHDKNPGTVQSGLPSPFPFEPYGVGGFCRKCHDGVDGSHFPRGNTPRPSVTCLSCHQVHGSTLLFPALRERYPLYVIDNADVNPHGGKIFCLSCHRDSPQGGQEVTFRSEGDATSMCRRCHQEVEHHPLGVGSSPGTWKMDFSDLPLEEEKISCVTCHDPYECNSVITRDNPRFLRGGPYNAVEEFCMRCHEGRSIVSLNPHDQIDDEGTVREKQCLYCHTSVPEDVGYTLGREDFTDELKALCLSCHPVGGHPDVDHMVEVRPEMAQSLIQYEERRLVSLPLDGDSSITCVTCHNPHERGLLKGPAGVGADEEKRLRLATFNEICTPCHGRH
jgi:hypothetical protein